MSADRTTHNVTGPSPFAEWAVSQLSKLKKIRPAESMPPPAESGTLKASEPGRIVCIDQCLPPSVVIEAKVLKPSS